MRKSRFTENEMVRAVKRLESGMNAEEISRELGISRITLYKWKSKYSGMEVIEKNSESRDPQGNGGGARV